MTQKPLITLILTDFTERTDRNVLQPVGRQGVPSKFLKISSFLKSVVSNFLFRMKEAVVRARVHADLKEDAERIYELLGINTTEAIRMFLSQVRLRGGLPFSVEVPHKEDLLRSASLRQAALDSLDDG